MRIRPRPAALATLALVLAGCSQPDMQARITESIGTLSSLQSTEWKVDPVILKQARGIAIVDETQAGLVVSGAGGRGLLMRRLGNGWSAPCVIKVEGFGVGLTLGGEGRSVAIVFSTDEALDSFVADGSYFVAQAQGTFGDSYGRTKDPAQRTDQVHVYAIAGGVYGTAALGGVGFKIDREANAAAYGNDVTEWDILDGKVTAPKGQAALASRLERIVNAVPEPAERVEQATPEPAVAEHVPAATN
jgi:lipid-binding SYLF domain-containing protein